MTIDEIAKNLLESKNCKNCYHYGSVKEDEFCHIDLLTIKKIHPAPNDYTCENWKKIQFKNYGSGGSPAREMIRDEITAKPK